MRSRHVVPLMVVGFVVVAGAGAWTWWNSQSDGPLPPVVGVAPALSVEGGSGGPPMPALAGPDLIFHPPVEPVAVDLREVPAGVPDPNSKLRRWQRGEWHPGRAGVPVTDEELQRLRQESLALPSSAAIQRPQDAPEARAPSLGTNFESVHFGESSGSVPPDPELSVGPNHVIAVVNVDFEVYDRSGNSLTMGPVSFASFFSPLGLPATGTFFDPNTQYDEEAGRYIIAIDFKDDASLTSLYVVAVSQSGDAAGFYWLYAFTANASDSSQWMDYPHLGVGRDALYMGGNMFTFSGDSFTNARIWAYDKTAMYAGLAASLVERGLGTGAFTPQPLKLHGYDGSWPTGNLHYFLAKTGAFQDDTYGVWSWDRPFSTNSLVYRGDVDLAVATGVAAGIRVEGPQRGVQPLAGNDKRPLDLEWGAGSIWTAQTIACNPGSGTVNCVRWAEINPSSATVVQAGVWAGNGIYLTFPDLAVNACGDMAIGYTKSSGSTYPSVWVAGRNASDPPGTLNGEILVKSGEVPYVSFELNPPRRWGDYTGMTVDPGGETFWYLGEYSKDTGTTQGRWGNWIAEISLGPCSGSNSIFADGFESNNLSAWSSSTP
jgi:hypothetical protein